MSVKIILTFLKIAVTVLYYFLIIVALVVLVTSVLNILSDTPRQFDMLKNNTYNFEVISTGAGEKEGAYTYSSDSLIRYKGVNNRYLLEVDPNSAFGYYALFTKLLFLSLGISVLWNFKKIFKKANLDDPFKLRMVKRLKVLAALFIISDIIKLINYFLFNSFLQQSITTPKLGLNTNIGGDLITGMIILLIAVVFQRGIALQEENALTV